MKNLKISPTCQIEGLKEIYKQHFANVDQGYFVEVGAYDGESWSNTSCLADIGWKGLYIEPIKNHFDRCRLRHENNNVSFENIAIGPEEKMTLINVADALSTLSPTAHAVHKSIEGFNMSEHVDTLQEVLQLRLETVLKKHSIPNNFELLVVDVEGYEYEVFTSFDLTEYRPKMIIAELCDVHPYFNSNEGMYHNAKSTRELIEAHGYIEVYKDCINTIFVSNT